MLLLEVFAQLFLCGPAVSAVLAREVAAFPRPVMCFQVSFQIINVLEGFVTFVTLERIWSWFYRKNSQSDDFKTKISL